MAESGKAFSSGSEVSAATLVEVDGAAEGASIVWMLA